MLDVQDQMKSLFSFPGSSWFQKVIYLCRAGDRGVLNKTDGQTEYAVYLFRLVKSLSYVFLFNFFSFVNILFSQEVQYFPPVSY